MELKLLRSKKKLELEDEIFTCKFNEPLVHQIVTAYLARARAGTKAQKTRAEVRGGGAKPWRQKGTGRARAGTIRSPLWRKGGVIFAAKPRDYSQKINKKMYKNALRSILSELVRQERLSVVESFQLDAPKTKGLLKKLADLKASEVTLIIADVIDENLYLAARNLAYLEVVEATAAIANPVALVNANSILVTEKAIKQIEESLR